MSDAVSRLNAALEGRYAIERKLGEGGMATVYLADDIKHNRKVALKVLKPELAAVVGAERFLTEIQVTANLQHPHILPLFDSGEADSFLFYVMPYVEGETLRDRIDREKQLPVDDAVALASKVAAALQHAHEHGGQFGLQDLEGDLTFVLDVVGQVDRGHATRAKLTLDGVAAFEGCVQANDGIGHLDVLGCGRSDLSKILWAGR